MVAGIVSALTLEQEIDKATVICTEGKEIFRA